MPQIMFDLLGLIRDYKDLITLAIALAIVVTLTFTKWQIGREITRLDKATKDAQVEIGKAAQKVIDATTKLSGTSAILGAQVETMKTRLDISAKEFGDQINKAVGEMYPRLQQNLLIATDEAHDALKKKLQSLKTEVASQVEVAVRDALRNGLKFEEHEQTEQAGDSGEPERWQEMSSIWAETKNEIDALVMNAKQEISDGRSRRRYNKLNGHHYDDIAILLYQDDHITEAAVDAAIEMNAIFNSKRNRKSPVTSADLKEFKANRQIWVDN